MTTESSQEPNIGRLQTDVNRVPFLDLYGVSIHLARSIDPPVGDGPQRNGGGRLPLGVGSCFDDLGPSAGHLVDRRKNAIDRAARPLNRHEIAHDQLHRRQDRPTGTVKRAGIDQDAGAVGQLDRLDSGFREIVPGRRDLDRRARRPSQREQARRRSVLPTTGGDIPPSRRRSKAGREPGPDTLRRPEFLMTAGRRGRCPRVSRAWPTAVPDAGHHGENGDHRHSQPLRFQFHGEGGSRLWLRTDNSRDPGPSKRPRRPFPGGSESLATRVSFGSCSLDWGRRSIRIRARLDVPAGPTRRTSR